LPRRRRLSPPPSPPSPPLPRLVSPFHEPIHGVDLVDENTGVCSLPGREDLGWAGILQKKPEK
jgi:hypothetical protein